MTYPPLQYKKLSDEQKEAINSDATHYINLYTIPSEYDTETLVTRLESLGFDNFETHPMLNIMSMYDC